MDLHDYEDVAQNYDLYLGMIGGSYEGFEDFYINLASKYGEKGVIDIACGTGALTLPLAHAGFDLTASDLSDAMIQETRKKLAKDHLEVNTFVSNMIDFKCNRHFSLAIIARSGFLHLTTVEDQEKTLLNIKQHLVKGGILTFNTFEPDYNIQLQQIKTSLDDYICRGDYVNRKGLKERIYNAITYEPDTQLMKGNWKFETLDDSGKVIDVRIRELLMRQSYAIQIHYLAMKCGYEILEAEKKTACNNNIIWILKKI